MAQGLLPLTDGAGVEEFGVGFFSARHGWVGTSAGGFETDDGGARWRPSELARSANKIRTAAADRTPMVYAIGSEAQIR